MTPLDTPEHLDRLTDRLDLVELSHRFARYADGHDVDRLRGLFTERITLDLRSLPGGKVTTVRATDLDDGWHGALRGRMVGRHLLAGHRIRLPPTAGPEPADVTCYFHINLSADVAWRPDQQFFGGRYRFGAVNRDHDGDSGSRWRIASLTMHVIWVGGIGSLGPPAADTGAGH